MIEKIAKDRNITLSQLEFLLTTEDKAVLEDLQKKAQAIAQAIYGKQIFMRGLIEFTNICKNDCYYCGIRKSNSYIERYRLNLETILECCQKGYNLGFRTFVLQGGEDSYFTDAMVCECVSAIKLQHPDCAVTLSIGERSRASYQQFFRAGADRYLLRHETANTEHYSLLHPEKMLLSVRKQCLYDLKEIGFQVGCGFMVGSPYQTIATLFEDLQFIRQLQPQMVGIGPFIPEHNTPFAQEPAGTMDRTLRLLALVRLLQPNVLLPATTALGTIHPHGREQGILHGANVIMPNLSPLEVRDKYLLYDNKISVGDEAAESLEDIRKKLKIIGYDVVVDRGDYKLE